MRQAVEEFGQPVFGLWGDHAGAGVLSGHGGRPCNRVDLRYAVEDAVITVTTGSRPLGGTENLVRELLLRSVHHKTHLPWTVTIDERLVMLPVDGTQTQFRVVEATTGDWMAAGGLEKRHLLLTGTTGTSIDDLELGPVALDLSS